MGILGFLAYIVIMGGLIILGLMAFGFVCGVLIGNIFGTKKK